MNRGVVLGILVIAIVVLTVSAWFVHNQFSNLQEEIVGLQARNNESEYLNSELQNQTESLESQNNELVKQLGDLTKQLALERSLRVRIVSLSHRDYWGSFGGLLVEYPFNVTVRNNDVVTVAGLTLTVKTYSGYKEIGWGSVLEVDTLGAGKEQVIKGGAVVPINAPSNLTYVVVLKSGDVVLDEFRLP